MYSFYVNGDVIRLWLEFKKKPLHLKIFITSWRCQAMNTWLHSYWNTGKCMSPLRMTCTESWIKSCTHFDHYLKKKKVCTVLTESPLRLSCLICRDTHYSVLLRKALIIFLAVSACTVVTVTLTRIKCLLFSASTQQRSSLYTGH